MSDISAQVTDDSRVGDFDEQLDVNIQQQLEDGNDQNLNQSSLDDGTDEDVAARRQINVQSKDGIPEYKTNKDRYVGQVDPETKLRTGDGSYTYENKFFQYQGKWENGKKHGDQSSLVMKDGSYYTGDFENGEIRGKGVKSWEDGTQYAGDFHNGEKHGYGEITYGTRNYREEWYKGQWSLNVRQGFGQLMMKSGILFKGNFENHQPEGSCKITYPDGTVFNGAVVRGKIEGIGEIKKPDRFAYAGTFRDGEQHGSGKYYIQDGTYSLEGDFQDGKATLQQNDITFKLISPSQEEEEVDPKTKKDPKKMAAQAKAPTFSEEEENEYRHRKILYEFKRQLEEGKTNPVVSFDLNVVYQGPEIEDPNPPEEDDLKNKKKPVPKGANPVAEEPELRMIKPEPVVIANETGRVFSFEIGRFEKVFVADHTPEEVKALEEEGKEVPAEFFEQKWIRYYFNQASNPEARTDSSAIEQTTQNANPTSFKEMGNVSPNITQDKASIPSSSPSAILYKAPEKEALENMLHKVESKGGVCELRDICFELDDSFQAGTYQIVIRDVTDGLPYRFRTNNVKVLIKFVDLDKEAAQAAAALPVPKGKKR